MQRRRNRAALVGAAPRPTQPSFRPAIRREWVRQSSGFCSSPSGRFQNGRRGGSAVSGAQEPAAFGGRRGSARSFLPARNPRRRLRVAFPGRPLRNAAPRAPPRAAELRPPPPALLPGCALRGSNQGKSGEEISGRRDGRKESRGEQPFFKPHRVLGAAESSGSG